MVKKIRLLEILSNFTTNVSRNNSVHSMYILLIILTIEVNNCVIHSHSSSSDSSDTGIPLNWAS